MKMFIAIVMFVFGAIAAPALAADRIVMDPYGILTNARGEDALVYAVHVGPDPVFRPEHRTLATLVGLYLANGAMWTPRADGMWVKVEYPRILSDADLRLALTKGLTAIETVTATTAAPDFMDGIPTENILGVLRFDSGSLRIYLRDSSEPAARTFAETIIERRAR